MQHGILNRPNSSLCNVLAAMKDEKGLIGVPDEFELELFSRLAAAVGFSAKKPVISGSLKRKTPKIDAFGVECSLPNRYRTLSVSKHSDDILSSAP